MKKFKIVINLNNYFYDHRSSARIFINNGMKKIADLQQHISNIFHINGFDLVCQNQYLPPSEDVRILQKDDIVWAVPAAKATTSPHSNTKISEINNVAHKKCKNNSEILIGVPSTSSLQKNKQEDFVEQQTQIEGVICIDENTKQKKRKSKLENHEIVTEELPPKKKKKKCKEICDESREKHTKSMVQLNEKTGDTYFLSKSAGHFSSTPLKVYKNPNSTIAPDKVDVDETQFKKDTNIEGTSNKISDNVLLNYKKRTPVPTITETYLQERTSNKVDIKIVKQNVPKINKEKRTGLSLKKLQAVIASITQNKNVTDKSGCNSFVLSGPQSISEHNYSKTSDLKKCNIVPSGSENKVLKKEESKLLEKEESKTSKGNNSLSFLSNKYLYNTDFTNMGNIEKEIKCDTAESTRKSADSCSIPGTSSGSPTEIQNNSTARVQSSSVPCKRKFVEPNTINFANKETETNYKSNITPLKLIQKYSGCCSVPHSNSSAPPEVQSSRVHDNRICVEPNTMNLENKQTEVTDKSTAQSNQKRADSCSIPCSNSDGTADLQNSSTTCRNISVESNINCSDMIDSIKDTTQNKKILVTSNTVINNSSEEYSNETQESTSTGISDIPNKITLEPNDISQTSEHSEITDNVNYITKRKRKRVRKRKSRNSYNGTPIPVQKKYDMKPLRTVACPKLHIKFDSEVGTFSIDTINENADMEITENVSSKFCQSLESNVECEKPEEPEHVIKTEYNTTIQSEANDSAIANKSTIEISSITINTTAGDSVANVTKELPLDDAFISKQPSMKYLLPKIGDCIAFKILRITDDYTPELSDYIVGKVMNYQPEDKKVYFDITSGLDQFAEPKGKFSVELEEDGSIGENKNKTYKEFFWHHLTDPRLLFP